MHKMSRIIAYFHHQFLFFNKHRQSNSKGIKYKYELKGLNYYCLNYHHFIKICSKFRSRFLEHGGQLGAGQHGAEGSGGGVQMGPTEHRRVRRRPEFRHAVRLQRGKLQHNVAHGLPHVEEFVPQGHLDERLGHQAGSLHGCRAARAEGTGAEAGPAVELSHRFHSLHVELFAREARGKLHEHVGQLDGTFRFTNEKKKKHLELSPFSLFTDRIGTEIRFYFGRRPWSPRPQASKDFWPSNRTTRSCRGNSTKFLTSLESRSTSLPV